MTVVEEGAPGGTEHITAPDSVVAQPTRPDASTVAEAVPPLTPAAPVEPVSVETPAPPAPTPEFEAELAELKSEISDLKASMKSDLEAGLSRLKSEMKTEMSQLKSDLKSDLKSELSELKTDVKSNLEAELAELKNKLESQPKPVAQPAAPPPAPPPPVRPAEDNIFEESKGGASNGAVRDAEEPRKPAEPDSPSPLPEIPAPSLEEPAVPAPATPAPAAEEADGVPAPEIDNPFSALPPEPVRRWFDDSGSHDTVGQLVEVHPEHVRIRKLNGRFTTVAISHLSAADQSYVTATAERLAAIPRLADTAGM